MACNVTASCKASLQLSPNPPTRRNPQTRLSRSGLHLKAYERPDGNVPSGIHSQRDSDERGSWGPSLAIRFLGWSQGIRPALLRTSLPNRSNAWHSRMWPSLAFDFLRRPGRNRKFDRIHGPAGGYLEVRVTCGPVRRKTLQDACNNCDWQGGHPANPVWASAMSTGTNVTQTSQNRARNQPLAIFLRRAARACVSAP
jgi:hypothetical protein